MPVWEILVSAVLGVLWVIGVASSLRQMVAPQAVHQKQLDMMKRNPKLAAQWAERVIHPWRLWELRISGFLLLMLLLAIPTILAIQSYRNK